MKLSSFTATVLFTFTACAVAVLFAPSGRAYNTGHYPICSSVAHEVQVSWQRGELSEREARKIIEDCLDWEDRQSR